MFCMRCGETMEGYEPPPGAVAREDEHSECALSAVVGGLGHVTAHETWCVRNGDADMGMSYRRSAQLVWGWAMARTPDEIKAVAVHPDWVDRALGELVEGEVLATG